MRWASKYAVWQESVTAAQNRLTVATQGFDTLGQKAAAARGEVEKTEQVLRSLNAAEALQNLRDADRAYAAAISDAQKQMAVSSQYGSIASAYGQFMQEHPEGKGIWGSS